MVCTHKQGDQSVYFNSKEDLQIMV